MLPRVRRERRSSHHTEALPDMTDDSVTASTNSPAPSAARRSWRELVAPYTSADPRRGWIQLLNTGLPFLLLVAAMLAGTDHGVWAVLALIAPGAALLVRLFMIQHDCGHGSFFKSRWANDLLGRLLGVLTLTPYDFWRSAHAVHHATTGNLDRRGVGDIATLTVREYLSLPRWRRILYRVYRHPLVLFGIGPAYQFLLRHRIPTGHPVRQWRNWLSILGTNAALAAVVVAIALTIGLRPFLLSYVRYESNRPKMMIGAFVERHGIRLVHVPKGWTEPGRIQQMGVDGFRALGEKGIGAIPSLALHLTNGPFHASAAFALAGIGPASLPALVNALDSGYQQARFGAVSALGHLGAAARPAVPALLQLYQRDPGMRTAIRNELMFIDEDMLAKLDKGEQAAAPNAALPHR